MYSRSNEHTVHGINFETIVYLLDCWIVFMQQTYECIIYGLSPLWSECCHFTVDAIMAATMSYPVGQIL